MELVAVCALHSSICVCIASWTLHRGAEALSISDAITQPRWHGVFTVSCYAHTPQQAAAMCCCAQG